MPEPFRRPEFIVLYVRARHAVPLLIFVGDTPICQDNPDLGLQLGYSQGPVGQGAGHISRLGVRFAGCGDPDGPPVVASNVVVTGPAAGAPMAAGYLEIGNRSGAGIRITRVASPGYGSVEIHETVVEDGIARMREIEALDIADGETVVFERGGKHLMLITPQQALQIGERIDLTVTFADGSSKTVKANSGETVTIKQ